MTFDEYLLNFKQISLFCVFLSLTYSKQEIEGAPKLFEKITLYSLNINSIPKKIDDLRTLVTNNVDILVVQETKIDGTFSNE